MRHGSTPVKIASIEAIPSVIKYGEIVDWFEKSTGLFRITVAAPIMIGEKLYYMGVMLQRDNQNQRLYIHDVEIDEEANGSSQEHLNSTGPYESRNDLFLSTILGEILEVKRKIGKTKNKAIKRLGHEASSSTDSNGNELTTGQAKLTSNKNHTSNPDVRFSVQQKENATVADMLKKELPAVTRDSHAPSGLGMTINTGSF